MKYLWVSSIIKSTLPLINPYSSKEKPIHFRGTQFNNRIARKNNSSNPKIISSTTTAAGEEKKMNYCFKRLKTENINCSYNRTLICGTAENKKNQNLRRAKGQ